MLELWFATLNMIMDLIGAKPADPTRRQARMYKVLNIAWVLMMVLTGALFVAYLVARKR
jgi:hypothetical protein